MWGFRGLIVSFFLFLAICVTFVVAGFMMINSRAQCCCHHSLGILWTSSSPLSQSLLCRLIQLFLCFYLILIINTKRNLLTSNIIWLCCLQMRRAWSMRFIEPVRRRREGARSGVRKLIAFIYKHIIAHQGSHSYKSLGCGAAVRAVADCCRLRASISCWQLVSGTRWLRATSWRAETFRGVFSQSFICAFRGWLGWFTWVTRARAR